VKVLFDQNIPRNLRQFLTSHEVRTAAQMGWEKLENGMLLKAAEDGGFHVFVTGDTNLRYQQNLKSRKIAIVALTKNNWPLVEPHVNEIVVAVSACKEGNYKTVNCNPAPGLRRPNG
jgi:hypothetical protein